MHPLRGQRSRADRADERYGVMVALTHSGIALLELVEAVDKIRTVPSDGELYALDVFCGSVLAAKNRLQIKTK